MIVNKSYFQRKAWTHQDILIRRKWLSKGIFSLFMLLCMVARAIDIASIEELQKIGNDPGYPLDGNYELTGWIYATDTAGWNDNAGFDPIGDAETPFTGFFDGQGHTIVGLVINRPSETHAGLFSWLGEGSEVKNLQLLDGQVIGGSYVGGIAGLNEGKLTACSTTGPVGMAATGLYIGGLVGWNSGTITLCYALGPVEGFDYVGGLVGYGGSGAITRSFAAGAVTSSVDDAGGLIGYGGNTVTECYATGAVTAVLYAAGGLVGGGVNTVTSCYATGAVSCGDEVGGLVGVGGTLKDCYATGAVTGSGSQVGGLAGVCNSASASFWNTETSGISTSACGTGVTTSAMMTQATFMGVGWDFTLTWGMLENYSYPYLRGLFEKVVPNTVGNPRENAVDAITAADLILGRITESYSPSVPADHVISQSPVAEAIANMKTPVHLVISLGSGEGEMEGETEVGVCPDTTVFGQEPAPTTTAGMPYTSQAGTSFRVYDDFTATECVDTVRWWGIDSIVSDLCVRDSYPFQIDFIEDVGGTPTGAWLSQGVAVTRSDTGARIYGYHVYLYEARLDSPMCLSYGWVSIIR